MFPKYVTLHVLIVTAPPLAPGVLVSQRDVGEEAAGQRLRSNSSSNNDNNSKSNSNSNGNGKGNSNSNSYSNSHNSK